MRIEHRQKTSWLASDSGWIKKTGHKCWGFLNRYFTSGRGKIGNIKKRKIEKHTTAFEREIEKAFSFALSRPGNISELLSKALEKWPINELLRSFKKIEASPKALLQLATATDRSGFLVLPRLLERPKGEVEIFFSELGFSILLPDLDLTTGANNLSSRVLDFFVKNHMPRMIVKMVRDLPVSFVRSNLGQLKQLMEKDPDVAAAVCDKILALVSKPKHLGTLERGGLRKMEQEPERFFEEANRYLSWDKRF